MDALWGEEPPRSAVGMVHTYISRLRSVLGAGGAEDGGLLVRNRGGYRLSLDQDQLDVLRFRRLVESARRLRAAGDAGGRVASMSVRWICGGASRWPISTFCADIRLWSR
jgi:DNA-binding SARP family transcriptional activator